MLFLDRKDELAALERMDAGLAVVWGRRRIGKTRLLLEWCERQRGLYTVADQSSAEVQRAYLARALDAVLPGFAAVTYPDWERLLSRLAADAIANKFTGPLVIDELPYLVVSSPELPSVLQRWIDHDAKRARLRVALAGSSQRMMQGLALAANAPLYGRAEVLLDVKPLAPRYLTDALDGIDGIELLEHFSAWGGVPRYWELASTRRGSARERLAEIALDPLGPLFSEAERLLLEESPMALEVRPLLDAIGSGAHRLSEIAGRLGRPATSLAKPLDRLLGMGFIRRETPYGDPLRGGKRSLYKIDDPFLRLWFRVIAPNRATLTAGSRASRLKLLDAHWDALCAETWEELCRSCIPTARGRLAHLGRWHPAQRYWHGAEPEWDAVADAIDHKQTLAAEVWHARKPVTAAAIRAAAAELEKRPLPPRAARRDIVRALFVPQLAARAPRTIGSVHVFTLDDLL